MPVGFSLMYKIYSRVDNRYNWESRTRIDDISDVIS
jgi:hypothetical protein